MCGRYTIRRIDLFLRHGAMDAPDFEEFSETRFPARFNIAPSQSVPIVRLNKEEKPVMNLVQWGLIPSWTNETPKLKPINARAETVATSGMFRQAFQRRRCLIPVDGFYEWKKEAGAKQPYFIHLPDDGPFAFAGLWERWKSSPDAEPLDTCTIITTTPNNVMRSIHDRMPVILHQTDYQRWMSKETTVETAKELLRPYDGQLEAYPVSTKVNSPKNDRAENVKPIE